jgi:hypothetical protein
MKIIRFHFTHRDDNNVLSYNTPDEAVKDFNKKGYGMHNWIIRVVFSNSDMNGNTSCTINLVMFNYLTDNWKVLNGE